MRPSIIALLLAVFVLRAPVLAQEDEGFEHIELRVTGTRSGSKVVVDRGKNDGVAVGDLVLLRPRAGGPVRGAVIEVDERTAVVELFDRSFAPSTGMRGEAWIPVSRFAAPEPDPAEQPPGAAGAAGAPGQPEWENQDETWTPGMPLLAEVDAVRPKDRAQRITGRIYSIGRYIDATQDDRTDSYLRFGTDVVYENPFHRGGLLNFDAEINNQSTFVQDQVDLEEGRLRLDRLSYASGGTRFRASRWEAGRFLQYGVPEFGVLDGFEWTKKRTNGDRWGASLGFMPVPDALYDTGDDFQFAGYYTWVADDSERLAFTGGYQKTFHDGNADRDLVLAKFHYLPLSGWSVHAAAWLDIYTGGDDLKDSGMELTTLRASVGRRWKGGHGIDVGYLHSKFPQIDRFEFTPPGDAVVSDGVYDRIGVTGWKMMGNRRLHGHVGGWVDENDSGGNADLGFEVPNILVEESRSDFVVFGTNGSFDSMAGFRFNYAWPAWSGGWDVVYEVANGRFYGFDPDRDDVVQNRLVARRDLFLRSGWNFSVDGGVQYWDNEHAWSIGFYLQKSF